MKHDATLPQRDAALLEACRCSDTETALRLIAEGADIRAEDEECMTPMGYACQAGNEAIVEELLRRGIGPNELSGNWERPALYRATESGNIALMQRLLIAGGDPWGTDCEFDPFLSAAVSSGNTAAFDFLLDMGLYIEEESHHGSNLMYMALRKNDEKMFRYLRSQGRSVHFYTYGSVLDDAFETGRKDIIRRLMQEGSSPTALCGNLGNNFYVSVLSRIPFDEELADIIDEAGIPINERPCDWPCDEEENILSFCETLEAYTWAVAHGAVAEKVIKEYPAPRELYQAAHESKDKLLRYLAGNRDLHATDRDGNSALFLACAEGDRAAIFRLLEAGATARGLNRRGESVLTINRHSMSQGTPPECVNALFKQGLSPEEIGDEGMTMLTCLIADEKQKLAMALLRCGVDVNHRDDAAYTPFLAAARYGNAAIARRLAELGADTHATLPDGRTALHLAAQYEQEDVVRYLLSEGHEVNARDRRDYTPLLSCPSPAIAHLLLDAGADPLCRGKNGLTALMAVHHSNELGIRDRLLSAGVAPEATTLWGAKHPERQWY